MKIQVMGNTHNLIDKKNLRPFLSAYPQRGKPLPDKWGAKKEESLCLE